MARFVSLFNFTEQGIRKISETVSRVEAFEQAAKKMGASVKEVYWLVGAHDGMVVIEAPDEPTVAALMAKLGSLGNVRTQTLRAYDRKEMEGILSKMR